MPQDNTVPQNTDGGTFASLDTTYTVQDAASLLEIDVTFHMVSHSSGGNPAQFALFRDSGANAIAAYMSSYAPANGGWFPVHFKAIVAASSAGSTTFTIRWSAGTTGTAYINTITGTGYLGGQTAVLTVKEIKQ